MGVVVGDGGGDPFVLSASATDLFSIINSSCVNSTSTVLVSFTGFFITFASGMAHTKLIILNLVRLAHGPIIDLE